MKRRYTTKAQDIAYLRERFEDHGRDWQVGDPCSAYNLRAPSSTIASFDGERVTLANGDTFHRSHLRRVQR